jgi:RNA polymerase primary sigma factor
VPRRQESVASDLETLRAYLREVASCPRVTPEEERELGRRIQNDHDEEALRLLVESNLRFVISYAKAYRGLGVSFLDLIHEGNLGLIEAARRFDPSRNVKFVTYAVWWIRQSIVHALSEQARAFTLPAKLSGVAARFGRDVAALTEQLDHVPTSREIADDMELSEATVDALLQISGDDLSLSERVGGFGDEEGRELGETIEQESVPPVEVELIHESFLVQVRRALSELDEKEEEVMRLRYGLDGAEPFTLQQIGDRLHLSRERIRQIEARAKEKLRRSKKALDLRSYLN